jgi:hypothetical protein
MIGFLFSARVMRVAWVVFCIIMMSEALLATRGFGICSNGARQDSRGEAFFRCATQKFISAESKLDGSHQFSCFADLLEIIVGYETAVAIGFQPAVEMHLIEVRGHGFLTQFVSLGAQERQI